MSGPPSTATGAPAASSWRVHGPPKRNGSANIPKKSACTKRALRGGEAGLPSRSASTRARNVPVCRVGSPLAPSARYIGKLTRWRAATRFGAAFVPTKAASSASCERTISTWCSDAGRAGAAPTYVRR